MEGCGGDGIPGRRWVHPGGKLREEGPAALSEAELLAILISTGIRGKSALDIAGDILREFGSIEALGGRPLEEFLRFKGMSDVKITRIAAALEIARRLRSDQMASTNPVHPRRGLAEARTPNPATPGSESCL
ncbi:MAG: hypothetical protein FJ290_18955 [Planctomycetes bacterium]|nr:hypothetical protein [Planctomycetota bacterium]